MSDGTATLPIDTEMLIEQLTKNPRLKNFLDDGPAAQGWHGAVAAAFQHRADEANSLAGCVYRGSEADVVEVHPRNDYAYTIEALRVLLQVEQSRRGIVDHEVILAQRKGAWEAKAVTSVCYGKATVRGARQLLVYEGSAEAGPPRAREPLDVDAWAARIHSLAAGDDVDTAIDEVFDTFMTLLEEEKLEVAEKLLEKMDADRLATETMIALLSITLPAAHRLRQRPPFFERVKARLLGQRHADEVEALLRGLS
jgi:hypothetical protein